MGINFLRNTGTECFQDTLRPPQRIVWIRVQNNKATGQTTRIRSLVSVFVDLIQEKSPKKLHIDGAGTQQCSQTYILFWMRPYGIKQYSDIA